MTDKDGEQRGPVAIRDAATLVLVRDGDNGLEVLLAKRARHMRFGSGMHVFPGGAVDAADRRMIGSLAPGDLDDTTASAVLELADGGLAFWLAAIRECLEECGLLLADGVAGEAVAALRTELLAAPTGFAELCERAGVVPAVDRLAYLSHWITPPGYPRRFSTRFFIATAPPDQTISADGSEVVACRWWRPTDALAQHAQGELAMMVPTLRQLEMLTDHPNAASAVAAARALEQVVTVAPDSVAEARAHRRAGR